MFHTDLNPSDASVRQLYTSEIQINGTFISLVYKYGVRVIHINILCLITSMFRCFQILVAPVNCRAQWQLEVSASLVPIIFCSTGTASAFPSHRNTDSMHDPSISKLLFYQCIQTSQKYRSHLGNPPRASLTIFARAILLASSSDLFVSR